jgi:class 3 adenylate cyclase
MADDGVRGIAVHIGARVSALAGASEVLVSSTVRDLVAGSGLQFEDRGSHQLKGVPDPWRVLALVGVSFEEGIDHYGVAMKDPEGNEIDIN